MGGGGGGGGTEGGGDGGGVVGGGGGGAWFTTIMSNGTLRIGMHYRDTARRSHCHKIIHKSRGDDSSYCGHGAMTSGYDSEHVA